MSMGGGSSGTKVSTYYVGMHQILCHGPADTITELQFDEKTVASGNHTGGTFYINAPDLFGGMTREGGVTGYVDILMGYPSQGSNAYLTALYGETIPYYRGVVSAVLRGIYVGLNYYMKSMAWRASRIHIRKNGVIQWQDAYAEVPSNPINDFVTGLPPLDRIDNIGATALVIFDTAHGLLAGDKIVVSGAVDYVYNGTYAVSIFSSTTVTYTMVSAPAHYATGPLLVTRAAISGTVTKLINAVHVLRDCLTDNTWGYGYSEGAIDETSWLNAAITCYNERLGFSWLWSSGTLEEFISNVLEHIQGNIYQDHKTGKFMINLVRKIETTTGLLELNNFNSFNINDFHRSSIGDLVSSVTIKYRDAATGKSATSPPATDLALSQRQSVPIEKVITYDGVKTIEVAQKLALRQLQQLSHPAYSFSIEANRDAENMHKGDAFIVNRPDYHPTPLIMRVVDLDLGTMTNGRININCVQDVFAAADAIYITPPLSAWVSPTTDPINAPYRILNEVPYYLVATTEGDAFAQGVPTTQGYIGQGAASPSPDSIQASLWTDAGAGYVARSVLDFCFTAQVNSFMSKTVTSLQITNVIDIELLTVNHFVQIGNELLGVTNIVGNTLTVIRGVLDTVPEEHNVTDRIFGWHDYLATDDIAYLLGEVVNTKVTTVTPKGELALAAATINSITIAGRMHRPYPPGNLTINGVYWPSFSFVGINIPITWAHRNRFQQTTGLIDYYTASITTEASVTYSVTLKRTDTMATLYSTTGLTGTSATIVPTSYVGQVLLEVWSVNPNGVSFQKANHIFNLVNDILTDETLTPITDEFGRAIEI